MLLNGIPIENYTLEELKELLFQTPNDILLNIFFSLFVSGIVVGIILAFVKFTKAITRTSSNIGEKTKDGKTAEGDDGEHRVTKVLEMALDKSNIIKEYYLFHNLRFKLKNNKSLQIDQLLICQKGVFLFDTKSWNGVTTLLNKDELKEYLFSFDRSVKDDIKEKILYPLQRIDTNNDGDYYFVNISEHYDGNKKKNKNALSSKEVFDITLYHSTFNPHGKYYDYFKKAKQNAVKVQEVLPVDWVYPVIVFIDDSTHQLIVPDRFRLSTTQINKGTVSVLGTQEISAKENATSLIQLIEQKPDITNDIFTLAKTVKRSCITYDKKSTVISKGEIKYHG